MEATGLQERAAPVGASAELIEIDAIGIRARTPWELFWRRFREDKVAMASLIFLAFITLIAIFAPLVIKAVGAPGPNVEDQSSLSSGFALPTGPSSAHIFGVDQIGRDVFSRVVYGARLSLEVAIVATLFATVIGVVTGLLAGYFRGWSDTLISRSVDVLLAIPYLLLALGLGAACSIAVGSSSGCLGGHVDLTSVIVLGVGAAIVAFGVYLGIRDGLRDGRTLTVLMGGAAIFLLGAFPVPVPSIKPGFSVLVFVIAFTSWTYMTRIIRGQVLSLREKEFVEAARSIGASHSRIIFREILPNLTAPIVVYASILVPQVILYQAALAYLGLGGDPSTPSWGQMISDATPNFNTQWWYMMFPGLALLFTVLAFNLVGDAMGDALNPRAKKT